MKKRLCIAIILLVAIFSSLVTPVIAPSYTISYVRIHGNRIPTTGYSPWNINTYDVLTPQKSLTLFSHEGYIHISDIYDAGYESVSILRSKDAISKKLPEKCNIELYENAIKVYDPNNPADHIWIGEESKKTIVDTIKDKKVSFHTWAAEPTPPEPSLWEKIWSGIKSLFGLKIAFFSGSDSLE